MWKAELKEKKEDNSSITFVVEFSDGTDSFEKRYVQVVGSISVNRLKQEVVNSLSDLNNLNDITLGEITDVPVEQTQEQADIAAFSESYRQLQGVQRAIDLGLFVGNEKQITDLRAQVKADFKPAYINRL